MAQQILSTNTFTTAKWIVSATASDGTHTTIAAALTSASSGDTIFIRPGTYTENLTLKAGVNLTAFTGDASIAGSGKVIINGKCTLTTAGVVYISNIQLQTNSDFLLAVTGTLASSVVLTNCYLYCLNNTGITHTSSGGGSIALYNCVGDLGTTGITYYVGTSTGGWQVVNSTLNGGSTLASSVSAGVIDISYSSMSVPLSCTGSGTILLYYTRIGLTALNTTCITTAGTGTSTVQYCNFGAGSASDISIGAGTTLQALNCQFSSSNTNAVTGAGIFQFSGLTFTAGGGSVINPTTQTPSYQNLGKWKATGQPSFLAYLSSTVTNVTGDATTYTIICDTETTDIGSNYNNSTGTFTAPVTGNYLLQLSLGYAAFSALHTNMQARIVTTGGTFLVANLSGAAENTNGMVFGGSVICPMTAGDTCTFQAIVAGSTKTVSVVGGASPRVTFVSGMLVS